MLYVVVSLLCNKKQSNTLKTNIMRTSNATQATILVIMTAILVFVLLTGKMYV